MTLPDPLLLKQKILSGSVSTASHQLLGKRSRQEDSLFYESSEVFIIADGFSGLPHGDTASALAVESAIWTIRLAKQRHSYWKDKKLLGQRIIRSVNLALYNKRREKTYTEGMGSTLSILLLGEKQFYVYSVGDSPVYQIRNNRVQIVTSIDRDKKGNITKAVGISKQSPLPNFYTDKLLPNDIFILATDGIYDTVSIDEILKITLFHPHDSKNLSIIAKNITHAAEKNGSPDNMSICIIKNVVTS